MCYVKSITCSSTWHCHLTNPSIDRPHEFFSIDVTPEMFFNEDDFPNAWTKKQDPDELNDILKNIERCSEREVFKRRHQEELNDMLRVMGTQMKIPFQWDVSLYHIARNKSSASNEDSMGPGGSSENSELSGSVSDVFQSDSDDAFESNAELEHRIVSHQPLERSKRSKKPKLLYEVGEFFIIRTPRDHKDPFWIGKCLESVTTDAKEVEIEWYVLNSRGTNHLRHVYVQYNGGTGKGKTKKEMKVKDSVHRFSKGIIDVRSIHIVFKELNDGKIPPKVAKAYTSMAKTTTNARLL